MRAFVVAILVWSIALTSSAADLAIPNSFTGGTTAVASEVNANFDAIEANVDLVNSVLFVADPTTSGTTTSGIQEAIDACENEAGGGSPNFARCVVQTPCTPSGGSIDISTGLSITYDGILFQGCGNGPDSANSPTHIRWAGSSGGTMLTLDGVAGFNIRNVVFDCAGASNTAATGISFSGSPTATTFGRVDNAAIWNCSTQALYLGAGQVDSIDFSNVQLRDNAKCITQTSAQSVHNTLRGSECAGVTGSIGIDIQAGEFILETSYLQGATAVSSQNVVKIGEQAVAHIERNRFELKGTTQTAIYSHYASGDTRDVTTIIGNVFNVLNTGAVCVDWDRRGHLAVIGNAFFGNNSGEDQGCDLNIAATNGATPTLEVHSLANSHRQLWVAADFGGSLDYSRLPWTAGTNASVIEDKRIGGSNIVTEGTSVAAGDVTGTVGGGLTIGANTVALATDTTGNFVATVADSGASEVTVSGSGSENASVTLAIASGITRDSEWDTIGEIETATSVDIVTSTEVPTFTTSTSAASGSCTTGDLWLKTSATVTLYACTATDTWSTGVGI